MRARILTSVAVALAVAATPARAAEIRLAEQFSMGYLQFNVMKRDKLIEKYATRPEGFQSLLAALLRSGGDERGAAVRLYRHRQRWGARPDHAVGQDPGHLIRG